MKLNYALKDLRIDAEDLKKINFIADSLKIRNTTLAREILKDWIKKNYRVDGVYQIGIIVSKGKKK